MRKALVVGVNHYSSINSLPGCVPDAYSVDAMLKQHADGTKNFDVILHTAINEESKITKKMLKEYVEALFSDDSDIALLYFSGHGHIEMVGGYILTSECSTGDDGLSLNELLIIINKSKAKNKIVILDTCHSGQMGDFGADNNTAHIAEGVTILTASSKSQYATDEGDGGTFTKLLVDALSGAAANLLGDISPGSVYAHVDQSLGAWDQRPIFKTNVKNFVSLRKILPPVTLSELKKLTDLFDESFEHKLDSSYEPEGPNPDLTNVEKFAVLQKYNRVNLVIPVDAPHMYHAAMESKSCKLTVLGEYYWSLVKKNRI